ncbi:hypothetical protein [Novosphingobium sp. 9]|uniref:hypothetical protein n=1 Tax=Novosphingobium sp. 9 TaxID=2025349 RepID=UPI0021B60ABC|nr:hypothetical protein [Novosphingobium sp. 9]
MNWSNQTDIGCSMAFACDISLSGDIFAKQNRSDETVLRWTAHDESVTPSKAV